MLSLLNAIYSKFTGDAALTSAFPGGLSRDNAPENTPMPYLVSQVVSATPLYSYSSGVYRTLIAIRFHAYGVGHDATGSAVQTLISRFDDALLTLTSGINDSVTRQSDPMPKLLRHDAQGSDVWEWTVTYEFGVVGP